jgi:hypothetical protein
MSVRLPLDKVVLHPLFLQLTERQQRFTKSFIETQNNVTAIRASYNCQTDRTADMLARKCLKHPLIKNLVGLALGYEPDGGLMSKSELMLRMSEGIRKTKNVAEFSRLCVLYTYLRGWAKPEGMPEIQKIVERMENRRKVV